MADGQDQAWCDLASHVGEIAGRAIMDKVALVPDEGKTFVAIASAHSTLTAAVMVIHKLMGADPDDEASVRALVREIAAAWSLPDGKAQANTMYDVMMHHFALDEEAS